jgi:hypothetical protein
MANPANHVVPAKLLTYIGDVTVSFAMLEDQIRSLVGSLINEHQRVGQIITAELPFRGLRALAMSLYLERHGEDDDYAQLRALLKRATELEGKRNQVTHSIWGGGRTAGTITRIKATAKESGGLNFVFQEVSDTDLIGLAQDLKQLSGDLVFFGIQLVMRGKAIDNPTAKQW